MPDAQGTPRPGTSRRTPAGPLRTRASSRLVYENDWLRLREDTVARPGREPEVVPVVELPASVAVVAVDGRGRVAVVTQWRYAHGKESVEVPTGAADPGDDGALDAARRELREETGLAAARWRHLGTVDLSNRATTDTAHLFLATELSPGSDDTDPSEDDLRRGWRPFAEAVAMVRDGRITEGASVAAVLRAAVLAPEVGTPGEGWST